VREKVDSKQEQENEEFNKYHVKDYIKKSSKTILSYNTNTRKRNCKEKYNTF
jgi:hypothetical protein